MTMKVAQVRLPTKLLEETERLVKKGYYSNKSDVMRDALRKLFLQNLTGWMPNTGDSVEEVRKARKELSKRKWTVKGLNTL